MSAPERRAAYQELVAGREFDILDIETAHTKATRTADAAFHPSITSWDQFCRIAKPKRSGDIAAAIPRRRRVRAPQIPAGHARACHGLDWLPVRPSEAALDTRAGQLAA